MELNINGSTIAEAQHKRYRGIGMVSGNNSSRLLLDYKSQHPDKYRELLEYMFTEKGLNITHYKLEMGSDINSSSGTEPCLKRTEHEKADATRGAGYQLAADAKMINPDLTIDMLWWSEPRWVTDAEDVYAARYKWYRESLIAAYETYGLIFDYISANRNERAVDGEWIKYLSRSLKCDADAPYDFSQIKIVAADEENAWWIADNMLADPELLKAVDVVGSHYTSFATEKVIELCEKYGKEIWFTEASAPMTYAKGASRFDGSGLKGINGMLDIATRFITMYPEGRMTLHEFQPVISSYYDGVTYCHKHLICADEPWSGHYELDSGYFMCLHFSKFFKKGWAFVESACKGDGKKGGDGHAIVDSVYCYMTATDTKTGDYSCVIVNTTDSPITYDITVSKLKKANSPIQLWETKGPTGGVYDENYFRNVRTIYPGIQGETASYSIIVEPYSIITLSTLHIEEPCRSSGTESAVMALPYFDDFSYSNKDDTFLRERGNAPLYTTDQGGAFEVVTLSDGKPALMQMITHDTLADEWGWTPPPTTNLGDDRWYNYSISADVLLEDGFDDNYIGIGLRYFGPSGWSLKLHHEKWELIRRDTIIDSGNISTKGWNNLRLSAEGNKVSAFINGERISCIDAAEEKTALVTAGRAALYSAYRHNCFRNLQIEPIGNTPYIRRADDTDDEFTYSGNWEHITMSSFNNYKRTISKGSKDCSAVLSFSGRGAVFSGSNSIDSKTEIEISLDGEVIEERFTLPETSYREGFYSLLNLPNGEHKIKMTVLNGELTLDAADIIV